MKAIIAARSEVKQLAYAKSERGTLQGAIAALTSSITCRRRGWTYVVEAMVPHPVYKIGRASRLDRRLWGLDRMSPVPLTLVALAGGAAYEATLHDRYADRRFHGEWFRGDVGFELVAAFARRGDGECLRCVIEGRCPARVNGPIWVEGDDEPTEPWCQD